MSRTHRIGSHPYPLTVVFDQLNKNMPLEYAVGSYPVCLGLLETEGLRRSGLDLWLRLSFLLGATM